ncbi:MAG: TolC family outer membrane protein [Alphaproteobacteria bacterium]|nr:TolC family outer membrane protein [Alphaproteobacteria bacterium]MCD8570571.1 TolC family outer membrane protein [Alphaproteobacteria bacterium]
MCFSAMRTLLGKGSSLIVLMAAATALSFPAAHSAGAEEVVQTNIAPSSSVTIQDVLREVYVNNPSIRAARAELRATHELLPQAYAGFKPSVTALGNVTSADVDGGANRKNSATTKDIELRIDQPVYRGGRTTASIESANSAITAQTAILKSIEQDVLLAVVTAYMDVLRDRSLVELNQNNRRVISRQLQASTDRFEVGENTKTDVSQSEARLAEADANLISAQGNLQTSSAVFEQIAGFLPPPSLVTPAYDLSLPPSLDDAVALAESDSPDVVSAVYIQKAAESDVDNIFGELLPEVQAFASWGRTYDPLSGTTNKQTEEALGVSAQVPLYEAGFVRSRIRQAKETANQNYLEILAAKRQARQETVSSWQTLKAAQAEIKARQAQVKAARVAREGVHQETEVGARTVLDALDADQEYLDSQTALVIAQRNEVVASFSLAATLGFLTPESLGFSDDKLEFGSHLDDVKNRIFSIDVPREK